MFLKKIAKLPITKSAILNAFKTIDYLALYFTLIKTLKLSHKQGKCLTEGINNFVFLKLLSVNFLPHPSSTYVNKFL